MKRTHQHGNIHHIIPRSRAIEWSNIGVKQNQIELDMKVHTDLHRLFLNMTPQEQLDMWLDINRQVIANDVKKKIENIVSLPKEKFYINELWEALKKRVQRRVFPRHEEQPQLFSAIGEPREV